MPSFQGRVKKKVMPDRISNRSEKINAFKPCPHSNSPETPRDLRRLINQMVKSAFHDPPPRRGEG
jgi:hypothetical protein